MKSNIFKYLIICLALGCLASDCNKEETPKEVKDYFYTNFTIDPLTGSAITTTFEFDASSSNFWVDDPTNYNVFVRWDFDYTGVLDILWDTEYSEDDIATHVYTEAKTYRVLLSISLYGFSDTLSKLVVVTESTNTPPVADFEGNPTIGTIPLTVNYTDQSTNNPTNWQWDFGSGQSISSEQNPTYTYNDAGTYTVTLTATNDHGSDDEEKVDYISVTDGSNACPGAPTVTDADGNEYPTVLIGDQCWMKENLKTTKYKDESPIPNVEDANAWANLTTGAYAWYENDNTWENKYGAMYNWYAVDDPKGLCPTGWHVPSEDEWTILTSYINGYNNGYKLKSCRQVNSPLGGECNTTEHPRWDESVVYGADQFGLSLLPGGSREPPGYFMSIGSIGYWWASTYDLDAAWFAHIGNGNSLFITDTNPKRGYSVRCLKDN